MTTPDTRLRTYLKAFSNDWLSRMCGPLSVPLGAVAVFWKNAPVKQLWAGLAIVAFFVASYRVWRNERSIRTSELENHKEATRAQLVALKEENETLARTVATHTASIGSKRAELVIHPRGPSSYIPVGHASVTKAPSRIYVELDLAIENKGNRTSNVVNFGFAVGRADFLNLKPAYPRDIQGRRTNWLFSAAGMGMDGHITIEAEAFVGGKLCFFVSFVPAGVYSDLHSPLAQIEGTLTVTDTEGISASRDFHLTER